MKARIHKFFYIVYKRYVISRTDRKCPTHLIVIFTNKLFFFIMCRRIWMCQWWWFRFRQWLHFYWWNGESLSTCTQLLETVLSDSCFHVEHAPMSHFSWCPQVNQSTLTAKYIHIQPFCTKYVNFLTQHTHTHMCVFVWQTRIDWVYFFSFKYGSRLYKNCPIFFFF